jgi:hypothetical protein
MPVRYVSLMKMILGAVVAGLILTACGSAGGGSGSTPGVTPSIPQFDVTVSEKDTAVKMRAGQTLEVVLHANPNMDNWTLPRSSDETVLAPIVNPAATAARGVTLEAFKALAPGEATVTSMGSPHCSPGQACPMYIALYSLKVTVAA